MAFRRTPMEAQVLRKDSGVFGSRLIFSRNYEFFPAS